MQPGVARLAEGELGRAKLEYDKLRLAILLIRKTVRLGELGRS
jgi:hypothetical protein